MDKDRQFEELQNRYLAYVLQILQQGGQFVETFDSTTEEKLIYETDDYSQEINKIPSKKIVTNKTNKRTTKQPIPNEILTAINKMFDVNVAIDFLVKEGYIVTLDTENESVLRNIETEVKALATTSQNSEENTNQREDKIRSLQQQILGIE